MEIMVEQYQAQSSNLKEHLKPVLKSGDPIGIPFRDLVLYGCVGPFVRLQKKGETCFLTTGDICRSFGINYGLRVIYHPSTACTTCAVGKKQDICGEVVTTSNIIHASLVKISDDFIPKHFTFIDVESDDLSRAGLKIPYKMIGTCDISQLDAETYSDRKIVVHCPNGRLSTGYINHQLKSLFGSQEYYMKSFELASDSPVCPPGSSGSAVFLVEDNNSLSCIGILIGESDEKDFVFILIQAILDTFSRELDESVVIETFENKKPSIDRGTLSEDIDDIFGFPPVKRSTRKGEITGRLYDQDDGQKQNKRQTQRSPTRPRIPSATLRALTMLSMSHSLATEPPTPSTPARAPTPPPMDHTLPSRVLDQNLQLTYEQDNAIRSKDSQEDGILDGIELTDLLLKQGRKSREVFRECQKICQVIKDESEHIAHVEAAYSFGDDKNVIFLVFATKQIKIDLIWVIEIRIINSYSDESRVVLHCKENSPLTKKDSQKIGEIIDMHSKKLMCDHKFLSAISASSVLSRDFGSMRYKHEIEKRPCIVFNVLVKGIIPLKEEYFPTELEGTPVDVREGGVRLCVNIAEDYQVNATIGCKITSSRGSGKSGTLGGFIEHPEYGLCGITCAHVVMDDDYKSQLKEMSTRSVKEGLACKIYQPDRPENKLGNLVQVTYKEGENGKPGVDLALFKIEKRAPKKGQFPDSKLKSFNTGLVWGKAGFPDGQREVQKFGYVTLNTTGELEFDNCAIKEVRFHSILTIEDGTPLTTTLYKQYHIKSSDENIPFCKQGDSGALVFMEDNTGEETYLRFIGMLVAVMSGNSGCVIPINAILDELNVKQFKPFYQYTI